MNGPSATLAQRVFCALADGAVHSGEQLAAAQGVTRSAVWKAVGALWVLSSKDVLLSQKAVNRGHRELTQLGAFAGVLGENCQRGASGCRAAVPTNSKGGHSTRRSDNREAPVP